MKRAFCLLIVLALPTSLRAQERLQAFFKDWRAFQKPKIVQGVPDYSAAAMSAQQQALATYRTRLEGIDTTGWTVPQRVDYHIVRAELAGMDFDHRVLHPWQRDPAFYVMVFGSQSDQPAREGPHLEGTIELWTYQFPLSPEKAAELADRIRTVPAVLAQAKKNLTGKARDIWTTSYRDFDDQKGELEGLAKKAGTSAALDSAIRQAIAATTDFRAWLEAQGPQKTERSGIGVANYNWYLKNVQLLPYTWQDEVTLMRRELTRARAALAMEENRNRSLPPLQPVASAEEWNRRFNAAVTEYVAFLKDHDIVTVRPFFDPALRAQVGTFRPGPREFFNEANYRDPIAMLTHDYHWIDLAWAKEDPHADPIRRGPLLYNIFDNRTEGWATAMEELMADAGFLDNHPRSQELILILVAQRAARALGDLMMHANVYTYEQSVKAAVANTPRGWLRENAGTVWGEQHLYLQQPTYGTSYLIGKNELEKTIGDLARKEGDQFVMKHFMDRMNAAGMIPASMLRWELTGQMDDIARLSAPDSVGLPGGRGTPE